MLTILFDGVAYGMLLFVLACGLAAGLEDPEALLDCMRRRWDSLPPTAILAALGWSDPDRRDAALTRIALRIAKSLLPSERDEFLRLHT